MSVDELKAAYEAIASEMIGRVLSGVVYVGMEDSEFESELGHEIDFGVDLMMSDGEVFGFIWPTTTPYRLDIIRKSIAGEVLASRTWDMSRTAEWTALIGRTIRSATVGWASYQQRDEAAILFPQDLELRFEGSCTVWLTTLETDNIYAVFDRDIARLHKLGSFATVDMA